MARQPALILLGAILIALPLVLAPDSAATRSLLATTVQTAIILVSILFLAEQQDDAAKKSASNSSEGRANAALEQLRHTTTEFRRAEREILDALFLWSKSNDGYFWNRQWWDLLGRSETARHINRAIELYCVSSESGRAREELQLEHRRWHSFWSGQGAARISDEMGHALHRYYGTRSLIRELLVLYEKIGVAVNRGQMSFASVNRTAGTQVVDAFFRWGAFIRAQRRQARHRQSFNQFQTLASTIVYRRADLILSQAWQRAFELYGRRVDRIAGEPPSLSTADLEEYLALPGTRIEIDVFRTRVVESRARKGDLRKAGGRQGPISRPQASEGDFEVLPFRVMLQPADGSPKIRLYLALPTSDFWWVRQTRRRRFSLVESDAGMIALGELFYRNRELFYDRVLQPELAHAVQSTTEANRVRLGAQEVEGSGCCSYEQEQLRRSCEGVPHITSEVTTRIAERLVPQPASPLFQVFGAIAQNLYQYSVEFYVRAGGCYGGLGAALDALVSEVNCGEQVRLGGAMSVRFHVEEHDSDVFARPSERLGAAFQALGLEQEGVNG